MGKLVRDKIPDIISWSGKIPIVEILSDEDYLIELNKKLNEEVAEYHEDNSIEELADILEVLIAICEAKGYSMDDLLTWRYLKKFERGGFADRIFWLGNEEV